MFKSLVTKFRSFAIVISFSSLLTFTAKAEEVSYIINPTSSFLAFRDIVIQGVPFTPMFPGADITTISGQVNVERGGSTIKFVSANLSLGNSGTYSPGINGVLNPSAPGNWAYTYPAGAGRTGKLVYREQRLTLSSDIISASTAFNSAAITLIGTVGFSDLHNGTSGSRQTAQFASGINQATDGKIDKVGNIETISIPIEYVDSYPGIYSAKLQGIVFASRTVPPAYRADFDSDNDVDGSDFMIWQRNLGRTSGATKAQGDADSDGDVDNADLVIYRAEFGQSITPSILPSAASLTSPTTVRENYRVGTKNSYR